MTYTNIDIPPGIYADIKISDYHSGPGISNSMLGDMDCARKAWSLHVDPLRPIREETAGQFVGTLAHAMILEPSSFDDRYAVGPNVRKNTKLWREFRGKSENKIPITADQHYTAIRQQEAVRENSAVSKYLANGRAEQSAYWVDDETKLLCKCRPDWMHESESGEVVIIDLKTYSNVDLRDFQRQILRMGYHRQAAYYSDGYELASGKAVSRFVFLVVTTNHPFLSRAYELDPISTEYGRSEYRDRLNKFRSCIDSGKWPGYDDEIYNVSLPEYVFNG